MSLLLSLSHSVALRAQVNISGKPGLIYVPSATVQADGTFSAGYAFNPRNYAIKYNKTNSESIYYVNLVVLPRFEVTVNLLRPNGIAPRGSANFAIEGIGDRQLDLKYQLLTEKGKRPSVSVIMSAPFGVDNSLVTGVVVATRHIVLNKSVTAALTLGAGSPYFIYRADVNSSQNSNIFSSFALKDKRDKPYYYLVGPFGGINLAVAKKGGLLAEWDSQHLNIGAYAVLFKHWTLQAGLLAGQQLTLGTSYSVNLLHAPTKPSGTAKP